MSGYYIASTDYIKHHGILGQKWGKLNGPPYPLNPEDHSAREEKEGYTKSKLGKRNSNLYDRNEQKRNKQENKKIDKQIKNHDKNIDPKYKASKADLDFVVNKDKMQNGLNYAKNKAHEIVTSDEFKLAVGIGIGLVALHAAKRISQKSLIDAFYAMPNDHVELMKWMDRDNGFESLSDIPKSSIDYYNEYFKEGKLDNLLSHNNFYEDNEILNFTKHPFQAIKMLLNPDADPDFSERYDLLSNRTNNCMLCTNSLIMRLKGYNVMAQETTGGTGWTTNMITEWFDGAEVITPNKFTRNGLIKELASQGEGSFGNFVCYWKQGGGHSILYTVREDGVHFIDGQIGKEYSYRELFSKINPENCRYARLDNCDISKEILKSIEEVTDNIEELIRYN